MSLAHHVVFRMEDSRPLFLDVHVRRLFSHTVARIGAPFELLGWGAGDDHAHTVNLDDLRRANEFARRIEIALTRTLRRGIGFKPASVVTIRDQTHLRRSLRYDIDQPRRHGVQDPFHVGTSLPDVLGARVLAPYLPARIARYVPNAHLDDFAPPPGALPDPSDAHFWAEATRGALARATLRGNDALALDARRAVLHFAHQAPLRDLLDALQISARSLRRLRHRPLPGRSFLRAIELQAGWRNAPAATTSGAAA
ncbi:MAG TPA: hypothetical protein ENK57_16255 [Polyangiaceae bacterium]|nr:hypothetical protein [Polyangiaceae bacterium]